MRGSKPAVINISLGGILGLHDGSNPVAKAVTELLESKKVYHDIEVIKDLSGNDRVVRACYY